MQKITLYSWDAVGNFSGAVEVDEHDQMPQRSTTRKPSSDECHWDGSGWVDGLLPEPPPPAVPTPQAVALQTIQQLEQQQLLAQQRITRETILALAEERAASLGLTLEQLRAKNKGYAGLKSLDEQIAALRELL